MPKTQLLQSAPATSRSQGADRGRWWVLAVVALTQLMITLDITVVNIALPAAQRDLGFSNDDRQWVVTAYALAFGSLLLIGGRLADRIGRRTALIVGLAIFGAGSALGGAAPSFEMLVVARAIQGAGGALLAPAALATVTATFVDARERARAFTVFGAIGATGGAVGLLVGGLLTEHADWRWTLYVNLALACVALAGTVRFLKRDGRPERQSLDVVGTGLVTVGVFGLVFGLSQAASHGWGSASSYVPLLLSAAMLTAFFSWQARVSNPLLPLRILLDRNRGASLTALMLVNVGIFAVFLFLTYYLEATLGYSPVETGLAFLPLIGGTLIGSVMGSNVLPRFTGPRVIVPAGMLIAAVNLVWLTGLGLHTTYLPGIFAPLSLLGLGLGMVFPIAISLSTERLGDADNGVGSAVVNTTQQVGGSVGIALLSTLAASAASSYLHSHGQLGASAVATATLHSYAVAYWVAAGIFGVGALVVAALYRSGTKERATETGE